MSTLNSQHYRFYQHYLSACFKVAALIHSYTFRHGKNISYKINIKIKLIYMFAVWEYEEDSGDLSHSSKYVSQ